MSGPDSAFDIAASGLAAQRAQMDVIAQNLANANTLQGGAPFRPKLAIFESAPASPFAQALEFAVDGDDAIPFPLFGDEDSAEPQGVALADIVEVAAQPQYRYEPTNPLAAKSGAHKGFVALPDVDPIAQMIELVAAGRAYDANVASLQAAKQMEVEAADIGRW